MSEAAGAILEVQQGGTDGSMCPAGDAGGGGDGFVCGGGAAHLND